MTLINTSSNDWIVKFAEDGKVDFHYETDEKYFARSGIRIPEDMIGEFEGRRIVKLSDKGFQEAYKGVYCKLYLRNPQDYEWR